MDFPPLHDALAVYGLQVSGGVPLEQSDGLSDWDSLLLISPMDAKFWTVFTQSAEYQDGRPDAVDRWSVRVLTDLADLIGGRAVFPFSGPPHWPFYDWALRSGAAFAAPIHLLCHHDQGLFISYRGAIAVKGSRAIPDRDVSPCTGCAAPCQTTCPVDAFAAGRYDVERCQSFLHTPAGADCMTKGCRARRACPVGDGLRPAAMSAYFMKAFV